MNVIASNYIYLMIVQEGYDAWEELCQEQEEKQQDGNSQETSEKRTTIKFEAVIYVHVHFLVFWFE